MITVNKKLLSGTPEEVRATVEHLARDLDYREYLAGTWLRELAVALAGCDGMSVSAVSYDEVAGHELEVTLASTRHHEPIVVGRSWSGEQCQITLERWLPISDGEDIEEAVKAVHAILAASARPDLAKIIDATAEP